MKEIDINSLQVGDVLHAPVYCNYSYKMLLAEGTVLRQEHLEKLRQASLNGLCYFSKDSPVEGMSLELLDQVNDPQVKRAYLDAFVVGKSIIENLARGNPINIKLACEAADVLVEEIMRNTMLLLQLATVRIIDDYTFSHMVNAAIYAAAFGRSLGLPSYDIRDLCLAGLLHDVGKAQVPGEILKKPGDLTPEEFAEIKKHPGYGYTYLSGCRELNERIRQAALQHHERGDGSGYPKGLKQGEISLFARIIAIIDVYDALTSDRCYRGRILPHESAEILMGDCVFNRLDTELVRTFLKYIALYPLGMSVLINDGRVARVKRIHTDFPLRPVLDVLEPDQSGRLAAVEEVDLLQCPTLFIQKVLT